MLVGQLAAEPLSCPPCSPSYGPRRAPKGAGATSSLYIRLNRYQGQQLAIKKNILTTILLNSFSKTIDHIANCATVRCEL